MRSRFALYCCGHKMWSAVLLTCVVCAVVFGAGNQSVRVPWILSPQAVTLSGIAGLLFSLNGVLLFRNELSRLELMSSRQWLWSHAVVLGIVGLIPWLMVPVADGGSRFAYVATLTFSLCVALGVFLRTDTLALVLMVQFLAQTLVWSSLEHTVFRHVLFAIDQPPTPVAAALSVVALVTSFAVYAWRYRS
ncbi:hypothetical protein P4N68_06150 [Corynebacterium felinum]|uniref:Membrane protein n=1 Tax=Corynebacterium felinum TaxID=131318 RepID=A0ABU2B737_9CORY|nr:hypothetical protein [Corynebacterium felinum]MDF5820661.1 hypothetical protein [Corynebacterium felinum]MDR7354101.1 putative membrane protein [Corynebacterium felinum]WJY96273.1 hypothetical protein CFELI_13470 [Corynebacterium felinum]